MFEKLVKFFLLVILGSIAFIIVSSIIVVILGMMGYLR